MDKLKQLDTATDWKRVLKAHKSGVDVYIKKDVVTDAHGKEKKVPIYRGCDMMTSIYRRQLGD